MALSVFSPLLCVFMCILCALLCVAVAEKEKMLQNQTSSCSALPFLLPGLFFFLFLLFFPACSPPLHQGKSSPGAEIQFRSSSSAFCALTCSDSECALSYLLPAQIERLGAGSSPCFHAVLSGCYSCVLRPTVRVYGRPGAAQQAQDH